MLKARRAAKGQSDKFSTHRALKGHKKLLQKAGLCVKMRVVAQGPADFEGHTVAASIRSKTKLHIKGERS